MNPLNLISDKYLPPGEAGRYRSGHGAGRLCGGTATTPASSRSSTTGPWAKSRPRKPRMPKPSDCRKSEDQKQADKEAKRAQDQLNDLERPARFCSC